MEDGSLLCSGAWSVVSLLPIVMALGRGRIHSPNLARKPGCSWIKTCSGMPRVFGCRMTAKRGKAYTWARQGQKISSREGFSNWFLLFLGALSAPSLPSSQKRPSRYLRPHSSPGLCPKTVTSGSPALSQVMKLLIRPLPGFLHRAGSQEDGMGVEGSGRLYVPN